ncbi:MAG: N-acetylglucosamine-6-phosphate deacetylase [Spirochaetaceae bacterium]
MEDGRALEISVDGGVIQKIAVIDKDPSLPYVSPGFFDIQVNGYNGVDYGYNLGNIEDVEKLVSALAAFGTTHHHATIITNPGKVILERLEVLKRACQQSSLVNEALKGIHLEGPFISPEEGPRGAHDLGYVQTPDFELFKEWYEASGGLIKMITLAPEIDGAFDFIEKVNDLGVVCALGHTAADADTLGRAVKAGARISTHLGNGSHAFLPRFRNYIWEQAADDRIWASIIGDGYHLTPAAVKVISRTKGLEKLILISDSTGLTGSAPGTYQWGDTKTMVDDEGCITLAGTPYLAGAGFLLDWDIPHFMRFTDSSLGDALKLCTDNPRRLFGYEENRIEEGKSAHFILFEYAPGDDRLHIKKTLLLGEEICAL